MFRQITSLHRGCLRKLKDSRDRGVELNDGRSNATFKAKPGLIVLASFQEKEYF